MPTDLEDAADIVTGAVMARAVEPDAGAIRSGVGAGVPRPCLNCGAMLTGRYCQNCGQAATVHRTVGAFWHDFTHSILHFEGKFWRTLPLLTFKPGKLTRRYINGERARFVSPLALFLFSVFLLFAAVNWIGGVFSPVKTVRNGVTLSPQTLKVELDNAKAALAAAEKRGDPAADVEKLQDDVTGLQRAQDLTDGIDGNDLKSFSTRLDPSQSIFGAKLKAAFANPQLLLYKLQSNAYKFSWALIPISVPFVWLLFAWRREFRLYDHAIFVTYSLSFMSLLFVLLSLMGRLGPLASWRENLFVSIPPLHMFMQLRDAYQLRWGQALWRTLALIIIAFLVLMLFGFILLALGVA
jgi:hypothetical protein